MKKRIIQIILLVFIISSIQSIQAFASEPINIVFNGSTIKFDVFPFIDKGRLLVPVRPIFEALGAKLEWNQQTKTITATKDTNIVKIQVDNLTAHVNGEEEFMDVPAKMSNQRVFVPARFAAEIFGATVRWDADLTSVLINKYVPSQNVTEAIIGTRQNDLRSGAWWGENITKIAREGDLSYTFALDSQSGQRKAYLYQRKDRETWQEGEAFTVSRPPNILVDSQGYVHVIAFEPFDSLDENLGRIFHVKFDTPNTVKGNFSKEYLTQANKGKDHLTLDNYGTYFCGAAIGKDDTILIAYNNSLQFNVPGTKSLGVKIYNPTENKWTYETVSKDMTSNYCYTFAYASDKYFHVYAVEDDLDNDYLQLGEPYSSYTYRYGTVKAFQKLRTGGNWEETTLLDFNNQSGITKKDIADANLRIMDFTVDSEGTIHALIRYKGDYNGSQLIIDGNFHSYHFWKAENGNVWQHEQICPGSSFNWAKLWETNEHKVYYICSENANLYLIPLGTSDKYLISHFNGDFANGGATPFPCSTRSGSQLSSDLHLVVYSEKIIAKAISIDVEFNNLSDLNLPLVKEGTISGKISLPLGETAPSGGIRVPIFASTIQAGGSPIKTNVTIPEGSSSVGYTLKVNSNYRYRVWFDLNKGNTYGYKRWGVYSEQGVVEYVKKGTLIDVNKDVDNIDLTLSQSLLY